MKDGERSREEQDEDLQEFMDRAIRRLNLLEYVFLGVALVLALLGGALVAWLVSLTVGLSFRWVWVGVSLLLFLVPGILVYLREFRPGGKGRNHETQTEPKDIHG